MDYAMAASRLCAVKLLIGDILRLRSSSSQRAPGVYDRSAFETGRNTTETTLIDSGPMMVNHRDSQLVLEHRMQKRKVQ